MNAIAITQTPSIESSFSVPVFQGILNGVDESLVDARTLHKALHVGRRFATWIVERIKEYGFVEKHDFIAISQNREIGHGRGKNDYHLSLDMAKELAMIEKSDVGRMVRRYFIQCERIANKLTGRTTTRDERTGLRDAVNAVVGKKGLPFPEVYKMVHQRFNVGHIDELSLAQVNEATEYMHRLLLDGEVVSGMVMDNTHVVSLAESLYLSQCMRSMLEHYLPAFRYMNSKHTEHVRALAYDHQDVFNQLTLFMMKHYVHVNHAPTKKKLTEIFIKLH